MELGLELVWNWFGTGLELVWNWFGTGTEARQARGAWRRSPVRTPARQASPSAGLSARQPSARAAFACLTALRAIMRASSHARADFAR